MITKTETIEGKEYTFASSALLPKLYRVKFGRDMIADVTKLKSDSTKQQNELKAMDQKVTSVYRSLIFRIYRKLRRLFGKKD